MLDPWIQGCVVQRVTLRDGLVLDLDDYNELVISRPLCLTSPATGAYPAEDIVIDPSDVPVGQRPLLDIAGAICTGAGCGEGGNLHLEFSSGHQIDVAGDDHRTAWELYGKHHGYMACLPHGKVQVVRHDVPQDV